MLPIIYLSLMVTAAAPKAETGQVNDQEVLLVGDSMMRVGVGPALKKALATNLGYSVSMHAKSATGLARPDVYDWPGELKRIFKEQHFKQAVVFIGSNDCQGLTGASPVPYGSAAWEEGYKTRLRELLTLLCDGAAEVLWLGLPPMRNAKFNARITALNRLLEGEVTAKSCAHFLPTAPILTDKGGFALYRKVRRRRLKIRDDDGVHITASGGQLVTEAVLTALQ